MLTALSALYLERATWTDDVAAAWRPHDDPRSPVLVDPEVRFGRPSVRGISTEVLWEHADSGANNRELVEAFDLTVSEVQWALAYENMPRAA